MNIGLVFSGAMAKGAYELGALKAISEYFPRDQVKYISSASIGVLTAYAYSCGMLDDAYRIWMDINEKYSKLFVRTVLTSDYLNDILMQLSAKDFEAEKFYISLLNLKKRTNCYLNLAGCDQEHRYAYMKAAMAFVPLVKPVIVDGETYIDGAFGDNIPVFPMTKLPVDYIICVHFDKYGYTYESRKFDKKIIEIVFEEETDRLNKSIWLTRDGSEQMLDQGYEKTKKILDSVFSEGIENKVAVYRNIEALNATQKKKKVRLTGDIVFNNITKYTRLFTKTKLIE